MVSRLMELVQDSDVSSTLCCCREDSEAELLFIDSLTAREGEHNASRPNFLEGNSIEASVAFKGVAKGIFVLGKGRRVKHD